MPFTLPHDRHGPADAPRTAYIFHGILGNRRNLGSLVRGLAAAHPDWQFINLDLRNHGDAAGAPPPHDLRACAADLAQLAHTIGPPHALIGHSYGGKVALVYARDHAADPAHPLRTVWALDTTLGLGAEATGQGREVAAVIAHARALPTPALDRAAVIAHFTEGGFSRPLAQWMTTNVERTPAGFTWRFDLDAIQTMFDDYWRCDLWPYLSAAPPHLQLHLLRAARSDRWTPAILARLAALPPTVHSPTLDAGHWVHVDAPDALHALISASLTAP